MRDTGQRSAGRRPRPVRILVLGTGDIASAAGHALASAGIRAVLVRDPDAPVLRRGMSFDDAIEQGWARLDGLIACATDLPLQDLGPSLLAVTDTPHGLLLTPALIDGIIDARMHRHGIKPSLRGKAGFVVGVGPGFTVGANADVAIETAPEATGRILLEGTTIAAHGRPPPLGRTGAERFGRAPLTGIWWTFREIGEAVEAGAIVGLCAGLQVPAPMTGVLSGLVRRGSMVRAGMRILEIDPRGARAQCHGISPRGAKIAAATLAAVRELQQAVPAAERQEAVAWQH